MIIAVYCVAVALTILAACIKGHRARSNKVSVEEAVVKLREELEKDTPRLLCLMVRNPSGLVSGDVQKVIWDLTSFESKDWQDCDLLTLSKKRKTT